MSTTDDWTLGRLLQWTADYLQQNGSDSPRLDAEILLAKSRGCKRIELYTSFDEIAAEDVRQQFRQLVKRRAEGAPVAYLVGEREFYSLPFLVNADVLIPRPETEFLIVQLFDRIKKQGRGGDPIQVLDLGTGSGCLAVTIAHHWPHARVTAVDVSPAALAVARSNAQRHQVLDRIEFLESDLWQGLEKRKFDYIVSNPPYVTDDEYIGLDREVAAYEPKLALVAGPLGTEILSQIAQQAPNHLHGNGWVFCEISPMIRDATVAIFKGVSGLTDVDVTKDLELRARIVGARRCAEEPPA
ncbi:MAG: peptide chain release factor N(5)-glutamine methyltransferase [Planctomycetota bacterium]|nr:peptide chain release factor N(5)-glutamine methyltransferase [Planctomycetota bacterium]